MQKALDALPDAWFKAGGTVEEAVEVMAAAKGLRRKHADRRPWAHAVYGEGGYLIGLGRCPRGPHPETGAAAAEIPDGGNYPG